MELSIVRPEKITALTLSRDATEAAHNQAGRKRIFKLVAHMQTPFKMLVKRLRPHRADVIRDGYRTCRLDLRAAAFENRFHVLRRYPPLGKDSVGWYFLIKRRRFNFAEIIDLITADDCAQLVDIQIRI